MSTVELTDKQKQFLDNYIREHSIRGRLKKGDAENFRRRKEKVLAEIAKLPNFSEQFQNLKKEVASADARADKGEFKEAYNALKSAKSLARKQVAQYDPTEDLRTLGREIQTFCNDARTVATELGKLANWCGATAPNLLRDVGTFVSDPSTLQVANKVGQDRAAAELQHFEVLERGFWNGWETCMEWKDVTKFLGTVSSQEQSLRSRATEIRKACKSEVHRSAVQTLETAIARGVTDNQALAPIRSNTGKFLVAGTFAEELRQPYKLQFQQLRDRFAQQPSQSVLAQPDDGLARDAKVEELMDYVRKETKEKDRVVRLQEKFDFTDFVNSFRQPTIIEQEYAPDDPIRERLKQAGKLAFETALTNVDTASDEFFDLTLKSKADLAADYAELRGWGRVPENWTPAQKTLVESMASGMAQAIYDKAPNKFDPTTKSLNINGVAYGNPKQLGKGGGGTAIRYENLANPGQFIVLKMSGTPDVVSATPEQDHDDMAKELRNHRQLMTGDPQATGRSNILELHGNAVGPDGSLYMLMEVADGGDMNRSKAAMSLATESGALPEEARAVLNQYLAKQMLEGLVYLRDQNMTHFDIKEENLFMMSDGTVKVADFGASAISDNTEGTVPISREQAVTPGYAPKDLVDAISGKEHSDVSGSTKSDAFASGRVAQDMHLGSDIQKNWSQPIMPEHLTGAFKRFSDGLTAENPEDRITLESALESSYIENLDNYDPQAVKELTQAIVAYGKLVDTRKIALIKSDMGILEGKINQLATQLKDQSLPSEKRTQIENDWKGLRNQLEAKQKDLRNLSETPEAKVMLEEIRMLSQQLIYPSGGSGVPTPEEQTDFLKELLNMTSEPRRFSEFISLPAHLRFFKNAGLSQPVAIAAFRTIDSLDLTETNPNAYKDLEKATSGLDQYVKSLKNRDFARLMRKAADEAVKYAHRLYDSVARKTGNPTTQDLQLAKEQALDQISRAQAFLLQKRQELNQRLATAQNRTTDAQNLARQVLGQIAINLPPLAAGPEYEFNEFLSNLEQIQRVCERELDVTKNQFLTMLPAQETMAQFNLKKQADDISNLIDQMASDIDRKCFSYTQWIQQAKETALDALAGKLNSLSSLKNLLLIDVKKLTRDDWAPVGGADSSISTSFEKLKELFNELKVLVDVE